MASRDNILSAIRAHPLAAAPLPDLAGNWIVYPDRAKQFAESLQFVGGRCMTADSLDGARRVLAEIPAVVAAKRTVSFVDGLGETNIPWDAISDPHALEDVDVAVVPGQFAVAENGAIWVTDAKIKHRAILFIVQHLVLVVLADQIVNNMHEAYDRLSFADTGFGVFISGPSKTADIEQSLVIGAHGPRSLTVIMLT